MRPDLSFVPRITDQAWNAVPFPITNALDTADSGHDGHWNEHGDFEQTLSDGRLAVVVFSTEGVIVDYFKSGEPVDTWAASWDELTS